MERKHLDNLRNVVVILTMAMFPALISITSGCSKEGDCLTNTGDTISEIRSLSDFDSISLNDYVNLILTQNPVPSVRVIAGKNIIKGITTEVIDRTLVIHNQNTCNWLRSYDSSLINVFVSMNNIAKISYNSSGDILSTNELTKSLNVEVWGGCGTIDLQLNIRGQYETGNFSLNMGTADIKLRGFCFSSAIYAGCYGFYDGRLLENDYTYITNNGSNDCYVNCFTYLDAKIGSVGNVYYKKNSTLGIKKTPSGSNQIQEKNW